MKFFVSLAVLLMPLCLSAQQQSPLDDPQQQKKFYESIEKTLDEYTNSLKLENWQVFKADSVLVHDYMAMMREMEELNRARVGSADYYQKIQDKWNERIFNAFHGFLNESQWQKYLKTGASKEKKNRDKREAKRNNGK